MVTERKMNAVEVLHRHPAPNLDSISTSFFGQECDRSLFVDAGNMFTEDHGIPDRRRNTFGSVSVCRHANEWCRDLHQRHREKARQHKTAGPKTRKVSVDFNDADPSCNGEEKTERENVSPVPPPFVDPNIPCQRCSERKKHGSDKEEEEKESVAVGAIAP